MVALPPREDRVAQAIYDAYAAKQGTPRTYLGGSVIGGECERALYYGFLGATDVRFDGRLLRLFDSGHREEARVIDDLRAAGMEVFDRDTDGNQYGGSTMGGHVRYNADGVVIGVPDAPKTHHLLEVKTHNVKSFAELKAKGVKESKPVHWAQMQFYMRNLGLDRALYVSVAKDTDEVYTERLHHEPEASEALVAKAVRIITAERPPSRISDDPAWFKCKFCDHRKVCHGETLPRRDCRTCAMSVAVMDGEDGAWRCTRWDASIPREGLRQACDDHVYQPELIESCEVVDAGEDGKPWVAFKHKQSGVQWVNGNPANFTQNPDAEPVPVIASDELQHAPVAMLGDAAFWSLKVNVDARVLEPAGITDADIPF
jgi:CRISPR/Cas system-associated exonuclease Cas4 (RecB family)